MPAPAGRTTIEAAPAGTKAGGESLLDRLVLGEGGDPGTAREAVLLPSGRTVLVEGAAAGAERITVRAPGGEVELRVELTAGGPLLRFRAAGIALEAAGKVEVRCDEFDVEARRAIVERSGGELRQEAAGDATVRAKGDLRQEARICEIRAVRGDVKITANDDVKVAGERVRLNC